MIKDFENNKNRSEENFGIPDAYFDRFSSSLFNKIEWLEEHKIYPALNEIKQAEGFYEAGFTAPENYFDKSEIHLELIDYGNLKELLRKGNGFVVPSEYFAEGSELLKSILSGDEYELKGFSVLKQVRKENAFDVPENYFESAGKKIIPAKSPAKVIRFFVQRKWFTAAAAIIVVTLGIWIYQQYFTGPELKDCGTLACIDRKDLLKDKHLESLDNEELYEIVDTKKLEEKLNQPEKIDEKTNDSISAEDLMDEI